MPIYEYECMSCKHRFEVLQGINAKPLTKCPKCSKKVKRLISGTGGFIFKGPGFYATDYRNPGRTAKEAKPAACPKAHQGCPGCPGH